MMDLSKVRGPKFSRIVGDIVAIAESLSFTVDLGPPPADSDKQKPPI
jgi:hypothetical protein